MRYIQRSLLFFAAILLCVFSRQVLSSPTAARSTFQNPFVQPSNGFAACDPSIVFKGGFYYWARSLGPRGIGIAKSRRLQNLGSVPMKIVYSPAGTAFLSRDIWAPELMYLNNHWYIYYAADDGNNANHRMFVLSADTQNPQGTWTNHGKLTTPDDHWAIDGTVLQKTDGSLYFVWSGWSSAINDRTQHLYIAPMRDPVTIGGKRVLISTPTYGWEKSLLGKNELRINEAPEIIQKNGTINLVFSAAGSWSQYYKLGLLTNTDGHVLNPSSWVKKPTPIFRQHPSGHVYGVGHNTFTKSPDSVEDWIVYHGMKDPNAGWKGRSMRAQPFTWNANNTPNLGIPDADGAKRLEPSGSPAVSP
jgi:GH43 family beta-xylosidase